MIRAHEEGAEIVDSLVTEALVDRHGWSDELAVKWGARYFDDRTLLKLYDETRQQ